MSSDIFVFSKVSEAAGRADVKAQHNLGLLYCGGYGVTQNNSEAIKWFKKAAEQGFPNAIEALKKLEHRK